MILNAPSGAAGTAGDDHHVHDRIYDRHRAPGYMHARVSSMCLVRFVGRSADPVGDHLSLLAGCMGVESQLCAGPRPDLAALARPLALNPRVWLQPVSRGLATALIAGHPAGRLYVAVDMTDVRDPSELPSIPDGVPRRYYRRTPFGVVHASTPLPLLDLSVPRGSVRRRTAEHTLAAAEILADLVASARAWTAPLSGEPMPKAPLLVSLAGRPPRARRKRLTVLLVGVGALGQAWLESLLADDTVRRALRGGRLVLVDPDVVSESNLSRQTLSQSPGRVGESKVRVVAEEILGRWRGGGIPVISGVCQPIDAALIRSSDPDVIGLFTDDFRSRSLAYNAAKERPGRLVLMAGTEFTFGLGRAVETGRGLCLDHGPEELGDEAAVETAARPCGEGPPANVLTNALLGAEMLLAMRRWIGGGGVPVSNARNGEQTRQTQVDWALPARHGQGPVLGSCDCCDGHEGDRP